MENPRIEQLRRRVSADPASIAFAALAEEFRKDGRYPEAIETCRLGLQRHPAYLSARVTLGRALIAVGDYPAARLELEAVLRAAPENLAAIRAMAEIYSRLRDLDEMPGDETPAAEFADETAIAPPVPPARAPLALASFDRDPRRPNPAIERLERLLGAIRRARAELSPAADPTARTQ